MLLSEFASAMGTRVLNAGADVELTGVSTLEAAVPGDISFISSEKYLAAAKETKASALIVRENMTVEGVPLVPMSEPWAGVLYLLEKLYPERRHLFFSGISNTAEIHSTATIAEGVTVGPNSVIGPRVVIGSGTAVGACCFIGPDCVIGENCTIYSAAVIRPESHIGNRVILHSGAVIGADGFKFEVIGGKITKIPQVGRVVIEDDVEIGANTCVDRASFTETRIGARTKIDNLVQIAHNVRIGSDCLIVSQTGIAGSSQLGSGSILAAQVGVADNLVLGNRVRVLAQAGVKDDLPDGSTVIGTPARPFRTQARIFAAESKLPDLVAEIARLKARIEQLESKTR